MGSGYAGLGMNMPAQEKLNQASFAICQPSLLFICFLIFLHM
jgi:hypothetical protein